MRRSAVDIEAIGYRFGYALGYVFGSAWFWLFVLAALASVAFVVVMAIRRQSSR